jgi:hypothetical protein
MTPTTLLLMAIEDELKRRLRLWDVQRGQSTVSAGSTAAAFIVTIKDARLSAFFIGCDDWHITRDLHDPRCVPDVLNFVVRRARRAALMLTAGIVTFLAALIGLTLYIAARG